METNDATRMQGICKKLSIIYFLAYTKVRKLVWIHLEERKYKKPNESSYHTNY